MAIMTTGTFQFKEDGNTIVFPEIANVPNAFLVEEGKITQLNKNQKKMPTMPVALELTVYRAAEYVASWLG